MGGRSGGGRYPGGIEKADVQGLLWAQSKRSPSEEVVAGEAWGGGCRLRTGAEWEAGPGRAGPGGDSRRQVRVGAGAAGGC